MSLYWNDSVAYSQSVVSKVGSEGGGNLEFVTHSHLNGKAVIESNPDISRLWLSLIHI